MAGRILANLQMSFPIESAVSQVGKPRDREPSFRPGTVTMPDIFKSTRAAHAGGHVGEEELYDRAQRKTAWRSGAEDEYEEEEGAAEEQREREGRVYVSACVRNGACPADEVGGRVVPSGVPSTFGAATAFSTCPRLTSVCPAIRPCVVESPNKTWT